MNKKMKTLHDVGFTRVDNELLFCPSLHNCGKLYLIVKNAAKTYKRSTVDIDKKLLRRGLGNCSDDTIYNHARELKELGFIESYSKEGGINGYFTFTLVEDHENNPYVKLSTIENQLLERCRIKKSTGRKNPIADLLELIDESSQAVKREFVVRFTEVNTQTLLQEYEDYLIEKIEESGLATLTPLDSKAKKHVQENLTETILIQEILDYFCSKYEMYKGKKHSIKQKSALLHIRQLLNFCNGNKELAIKYIDVFLEAFKDKDPQTALLVYENILQELKMHVEEGSPIAIYGTSNEPQNKKEVKEAVQVCQGLSTEEWLAMLSEHEGEDINDKSTKRN